MGDDRFKVTVVLSAEVPIVGTDNRLHNVHRVTIMVGHFGPYSRDFSGADDNPNTIRAWMSQKQSEVQSLTTAL